MARQVSRNTEAIASHASGHAVPPGRHRVLPGPAQPISPPRRRRSPGRVPPGGVTRPPAIWPSCAAGTSSRCPPAGGPAWPSSSIPGWPPTAPPRPLVVTAGSWAGRLTVGGLPRPGTGARPAAAGQVHRPPLAEGPPGRRVGAGARPGIRPTGRGAPREAGRGDRPDRAAQGRARASGARLRRPRRTPAMGPPLAPADRRERGAGREGGQRDRIARPSARGDRRPALRTRLPARRPADRGRKDAGAHLVRE